MNKSVRNVVSVNGNPVDLQEVIDGYKGLVEVLELQLEETMALVSKNFNTAKELGEVLELTQRKLAESEALNGQLLAINYGYKTELKSYTNKEEIVDAVKAASGVLASDKEGLEQYVEVFEEVKKSKKGKAKTDEQVSVEVQSE